MKKLILSAAVAVFGLVGMNAQNSGFGAKAGVNISTLTGDGAKDAKSKVGFNAGVFYEHFLTENFSVQPELLISTQGAKTKRGGLDLGLIEVPSIETKTNLTYLNIPVMLKYYPVKQLFLQAGPQFGFKVGAKMKVEADGDSSSETIKDGLNSFDMGAGFGAGYSFTENIGVEARYVLGFSNIYDTDNDDFKAKNSNIQIGLFYKF